MMLLVFTHTPILKKGARYVNEVRNMRLNRMESTNHSLSVDINKFILGFW